MIELIAKTASAVVDDVRLKRNIRPLAQSFAWIMVHEGIDVADETAVERIVRKFGPKLVPAEVDRLIEICPDLVRSISADTAIIANLK